MVKFRPGWVGNLTPKLTPSLALIAGAAACVMAAGIASAQEQQQDQEADLGSVPAVIVTGSRIPQPNLTSTSPIQVVPAKEFQLQGTHDVIDLLNRLPQNFQNIAADFSNTSNALSTPGGLTTADLRGIGPQRTLVLVDGRRLGTADANTGNPNPAPDLDQIPVALIDHVEVVTGGASATYGSDAIAGVVNFIMKKNFEGFQIDAQLGGALHDNHNSQIQQLAAVGGFPVKTGSVGDGRTEDVSILAGSNIADGRGNITAYLTYRHANPVTGADRDFAGCQLATNLPDQGICIGSSNSNFFRVVGTSAAYSVVGKQFLPSPQPGSNPPAQFNANNYVYMARADERYAAGFLAHVDLSDAVNPYLELAFMNDKTDTVVGPSGLFRGSNPFGLNSQYDVNCSNPLLSAQQQAILCTPAQIAADLANPGSVSANVEIGRRNVEGGGRVALYEHTNYRAVAGMKGALGRDWTYDAYGQYYYTTLFNSNSNYLNLQSVTNALQVTGTAQNPVCISGSPCVPYNIFTEGGVTADQLSYLYTPGTAYGSVEQKIMHADITGDLGVYGMKSPFARDALGINFGFEHRSEFLAFDPDAAELAGVLSGFSGASVSIHNGYSVSEGFLEARLPLAQDRPGIRDLLFDSAYRYSDYSTAGAAHAYKFELQYSPVQDFRLRGSFQHAVRAPNIIELFNPLAYGQQSFLGVDPCAVQPDGSPAPATLAECEHTGVTAAQYGNGGSTNTIPQCVSNQCGQVIGGNPDLKPEQADTYSIGVTFTPNRWPNLTGSIDYYHIKLTDSVGAIPGAFLFTQCLQTGDPTYCSQIVRTPVGSLTGASVAGGGYILQNSVNIGAAMTSGIDVQGAFRIPLSARLGSLSAALNGAMLLHVESTPLPGAHTYDCVGLYGTTCQTLNPRWRHSLRLNWETNWNTVVSLQWRYIGSVSLDNNSSDPSLNGAEFGEYNAFNARLPAMSYLDLSAIWDVRPGISVRLGVNNLLDKDPPLVGTELTGAGSANTYPTYDILGRQAFMGVTAKF